MIKFLSLSHNKSTIYFKGANFIQVRFIGNCSLKVKKPVLHSTTCQAEQNEQNEAKSEDQPSLKRAQQSVALRSPWFSVGSVFVIAAFLKITCMTWLNFGEMFFTIGYLIPVGPWTPLVMVPIAAGLAYAADYLIKAKIHERPAQLWGVVLGCFAFIFLTSKLFGRPRHQPFAPNYVVQRQMAEVQMKAKQEMLEKQWTNPTETTSTAAPGAAGSTA